jgi:hypothetical protein
MAAPSPYPLLKNMRSYVSGRIDPRSGLALISAAGADPVHSIKRLSNDIPSLAAQNARVVGAGQSLYVQVSLAGALVNIDTGYSGNPLCLNQMRPPNSPEAWVYVADSNKMSKVRANGTVFQMGIAPPLVAPFVTFGPDARQIIDDCSSVGSWAQGGTAGAITQGIRLASTPVVTVMYDGFTYGVGNPNGGECSLVLAGNISTINPGSILTLSNGPEDVIVQRIYPGFSATITSFNVSATFGNRVIATLHLGNVSLAPSNYNYSPSMDDGSGDSGTGSRTSSGNAGVGIHQNSIVEIAFQVGVGYGIITAVQTGPDGSVSITVVAGATIFNRPVFTAIAGLPTIRCFTLNNQAGETATESQFSFATTIGTGYIQEAIAFDLSHVQTVAPIPISRPVQDTDNIHISILMDHPEYLTEGRILFDVDPTTNNFTQNYFYKAFRQSDLQ